jgi:hypothetical protein
MQVGGISSGPVECDIVDARTDEKLHTISLARVPRVGEELDVDAGGRDARDGVYRVLRVRYHVRRRKFVRTDDLIGISLYVERSA